MAKAASKRASVPGRGGSVGAKGKQQKRTSGKSGAMKKVSAKGKASTKKKAVSPRLAQKSKPQTSAKGKLQPSKKKKAEKSTASSPRLAQKRRSRNDPSHGSDDDGWRAYSVLFNGGTPFRVRYNKNTLQLFNLHNADGDDMGEILQNPPLRQFAIKSAFVGMNDRAPVKHRTASAGNSMLFLLTNGKYLYVGHDVYEFNACEDEIVSYHSPIGNNAVPYPYAVGKRRTYLMAESRMAENAALADGCGDPYETYYGRDKKLGDKAKKFFTKMPVRVIERGEH
jgi:hypothetical protein